MARPKTQLKKFTKQQKKHHVDNLKVAQQHLNDLLQTMLVTHGTKDYDVKRLETLVRNTLAMTLTVKLMDEVQ